MLHLSDGQDSLDPGLPTHRVRIPRHLHQSILQPNAPQPTPSNEGNTSEDLNLHARLRHDVVHHCHIRHEPQSQAHRHLTTFSTNSITCATNALQSPADHYDLPSGSSARQSPASRFTNLHEPQFVPNHAHSGLADGDQGRTMEIKNETVGYGSRTRDQRVHGQGENPSLILERSNGRRQFFCSSQERRTRRQNMRHEQPFFIYTPSRPNPARRVWIFTHMLPIYGVAAAFKSHFGIHSRSH